MLNNKLNQNDLDDHHRIYFFENIRQGLRKPSLIYCLSAWKLLTAPCFSLQHQDAVALNKWRLRRRDMFSKLCIWLIGMVFGYCMYRSSDESERLTVCYSLILNFSNINITISSNMIDNFFIKTILNSKPCISPQIDLAMCDVRMFLSTLYRKLICTFLQTSRGL